MDGGMQTTRVIRNLAALAVIVVACPSALFGGALVGCSTQGLTADCALSGIFVSPFMLAGAGLVAGLLTRGWEGVGLLVLGIILGMIALALAAGIVGNPVPIDPIQGTIATIWFGFPVVIGYGVGRGISRLFATRT